MSTATLTTVEQFAEMPREERCRFELVQGELIPVSGATPRHGWIRDGLLIRLSRYLERSPGLVLAEVDCRTIGGTVRRPDLSFLTPARWQSIDLDRIPLPASPDLAIEVLSPSETFTGITNKVNEYLASGSTEVWMISVANREIWIRTAAGVRVLTAGDVLESPLLPGFAIPVADVLANP